MKTSIFSDSQIMAILKQGEAGMPVLELYREHGMSSATFYKWCAKYGVMRQPRWMRLSWLG
jgi:putative transposase